MTTLKQDPFNHDDIKRYLLMLEKILGTVRTSNRNAADHAKGEQSGDRSWQLPSYSWIRASMRALGLDDVLDRSEPLRIFRQHLVARILDSANVLARSRLAKLNRCATPHPISQSGYARIGHPAFAPPHFA